MCTYHDVLITVEEGSIGGFSAQVMSFLTKSGALDQGLKFRPIFFPDKFVNHGKPDEQNIECGVDTDSIVKTALGALGISYPRKFNLERVKAVITPSGRQIATLKNATFNVK